MALLAPDSVLRHGVFARFWLARMATMAAYQMLSVAVGFHLYAAVAPAITLAIVKGQDSGHNLGRMTKVGSIATVAALGAAWLADYAEHHTRRQVILFVLFLLKMGNQPESGRFLRMALLE